VESTQRFALRPKAEATRAKFGKCRLAWRAQRNRVGSAFRLKLRDPLVDIDQVAIFFDDPNALVPQDLGTADSRAYELRTVELLREWLVGVPSTGVVVVDDVQLIGTRPDTLVVFRYHHRAEFIGRAPELVDGPLAEIAPLWEFAIDEEDRWARGKMDGPGVLAASIGSAFTASELMLADVETLRPIRRAPAIFPRLDPLDQPRPTGREK
jgi:hypothetical protein